MGTARRWLRRIGSAAVALAVATLGFVVAIAVSTPASAAGSDIIKVKMAGDSTFAASTPKTLIDVSDLVPGGSVSGTMQVRDNSGTTGGSGSSDTIYLQMINVATSSTCPAGDSSCTDAGQHLANALDFELTVTSPPGGTELRHTDETVANLRNGVLLARGLTEGDTLGVTLTASLPFDSVGNEIQYGQLAFDLQLGLTTVAAESNNQPGSGGGGTGPNAGGVNAGDQGAGQAGSGGGINVKGEQRNEGGQQNAQADAQGNGHHDTDVLVLGNGEHDSNGVGLSYTGVPTRLLVTVALAVLVGGAILLLLARRRRAPSPDDAVTTDLE